MSTKKTKLELTWIGKDQHLKLEPRILLEAPEYSYHAEHRVGENDRFDNMLIHGDNLLALKALEAEYSGKVRCVYIDPPYNTGSAFEHYEDGLEHSKWLSLMQDRIKLLRGLLAPNGFMACHIDDSEGHYLKVMLDELFGRENYMATIYIQVRYPSKTLKQDMSFHKLIEQVHIYRKEKGYQPNQMVTMDSGFDKFCYYIREFGEAKKLELGGKKVEIFENSDYEIIKKKGTPNGLKEIWATGSILDGNSSGRFFRDYLIGRQSIDNLGSLYKVYGIGDDQFDYRYFTGPKRKGATKGKYYQGVPITKLQSAGIDGLIPIDNYYNLAAEFGNCRHEGGVDFRSGKKPEVLLETVLRHFSDPGDLVLDSFGGSGTTGAVAHKMNRRWIMVELGDHCHTHIVPRLRKVIDGNDPGGITESAGWKGGGGFRYYRLASSLLERDGWGNWIISRQYNPAMLAEALCRHMGFTFAPSQEYYWMHGNSSEADFIYVTTTRLSHDRLLALSEEVGEDRTLLVCCRAFKGEPRAYPNLSLTKIPYALLKRCEWGRDDYSLNVENLPQAPCKPEQPCLDLATPENSNER